MGAEVGGREPGVGRWLVTTAGWKPARRSCAAPPESGGEPPERLDRQLEPEEDPGENHDVYENKGTYMKFREIAGNCMALIQKDLSHPGGSGGGKRGIKNDGLSHDLLENKGLGSMQIGLSHDVYEIKRVIFKKPRYA
jgi:hypothetical protein